MGAEKEVRIRLRALDRISRVLTRVRKKFPQLERAVKRAANTFKLINEKTKAFRKTLGKLSSGMKSVGSRMTRGVTLPVGLAAAAILRVGVNFQKSINKVGAITRTIIGGKVTPAFEALEKQAMELGRTTEFSSIQAADAMVLLGRAGFSANEILASTSDVLALASATGNELAFTADVMAKTIRQFGLEAKDASRVSDVFADVARRTNVDLESISETMKDAAPIAKQYGASLEQTAAIVGLLGDIGIQGSKAGTTLKNILIKLSAPSKTAAKLMDRMGISVKKMDGTMMSAGEVLTAIGPKIGNLNKGNQLAIMNELFGLRGIAGAMGLMSRAIKDGKNPVATLTEILKKNNGVAKEMQKIMLRGAPGALARFRSALEGAGLAFAKSGLLDAFAEILQLTTGWLSGLAKLDKSTLKIITVIAGLAAALGPLLIVMGSVTGIISNLILILPTLAALLSPVAIEVLAISAPILLVALAVGLAVAGMSRFANRWSSMVAAFKRSKGIISGIGSAIGAFFTDRDEVAISRNASKGVFPGRRQDRGFDPIAKVNTNRERDKTQNAFNPMISLNRMLLRKQDENAKKSRFGPAIGANKAINQVGTRGVTQTNNARVDIDIKNAPPGTKVKSSSDTPGMLGLNLGMVGGLQ